MAPSSLILDDLKAARSSGGIVWFPAEERLLAAGRQEFSRYGRAQAISFTDATSFAVMRRAGIRAAFTGDCDHFLAAGFQTVPSKADLGGL